MQNLLSKFSNLSVNTESKHPTVTDSARIDTTLFDKDTPSSASTQRAEMPLVTDVVFKHSSAFNSERASGMSKLEQLQFVEMMKKNIVEEASIAYPELSAFHIVTARKNPASPANLCEVTVHAMFLVAASSDGSMVVARSSACEYLADAVEDLWEQVLLKIGTEGFGADDKVPPRRNVVERVDSGETLIASKR